MLVLGIAGLVAGVVLGIVASHQHGGAAVALVVVCVLIIAASIFVLAGLTPVVPGRARVVQLFGRYPRHHPRFGSAVGQPVHPPDRGLHPDP